MPRTSTLTHDLVAAAAEELVAQGLRPTMRALREKLGGVGSMQTIGRFLRDWQASQSPGSATDEPLPAAVQQAIRAFVAARLAEAQASLTAQLEGQQQELDGLAADNDRLNTTLQEQAEAIESLQTERATAMGQAAQLKSELDRVLAELREARAALELARIEQAKAEWLQETLKHREAELDRCRQTFEVERQARAAADQAAAVATALQADLERRLAGIPTSRRGKANS